MHVKKWIYGVTTALLLAPLVALPQKQWEQKMNKEGIQVYTKDIPNSSFKAIRTVCYFETSLTKIAAVLLDIPASPQWVYSTKSCSILKPLGPGDLIYYSEIAVPWPVSNRDFIVRLMLRQDAKTKVITVDGENKPSFLPEKNGIVRIQKTFSKWVITPVANGVKVEYELQADPGGSVPAWLINLFVTKGPFESFKGLRQQLKKPAYSQVKLPFIID